MKYRLAIFALLVGVTAWLCQSSPRIHGGNEPGVIMKLPERIDGMVGRLGEPDAVEKERLPSDTEFVKMNYETDTYDPARRDVIHCSIVLSGAERRSIHRPEVCLQGQGWSLESSKVLEIDIDPAHKLAVKDLCIERMVTLPRTGERRRLRAHYVYWFIGADVSTPSHLERVWLSLWDNISRNINHRWAYPSFMAVVTDNFSPREIGERPRSDTETVAMLEKLIRDLAPRFQKSLMPQEEREKAMLTAQRK